MMAPPLADQPSDSNWSSELEPMFSHVRSDSLEPQHLPYSPVHGPPSRHGSGTPVGHWYPLTCMPVGILGTLTTASLSAFDALILPSLSPPDSYSQYQDLLYHMAGALNFPVEDIQDPQDHFLGILQLVGPSHTALPILITLLQPAQGV